MLSICSDWGCGADCLFLRLGNSCSGPTPWNFWHGGLEESMMGERAFPLLRGCLQRTIQVIHMVVWDGSTPTPCLLIYSCLQMTKLFIFTGKIRIYCQPQLTFGFNSVGYLFQAWSRPVPRSATSARFKVDRLLLCSLSVIHAWHCRGPCIETLRHILMEI